MKRRRAALTILALVALLIVAPAAFASAGGGSSGFTGGGGHGGGHGFVLYVVLRLLIDIAIFGHGLGLLVIIGLAFLFWLVRYGIPKLKAFWSAREQAGRASRRTTAKRERRVELAAAEAADVEEIFDPEHVRAAAGALFMSIQAAWDADNRIALRGLVAPTLLQEWERRLDDFERKGWRNRVAPIDEPSVEYVGLKRRGQADEHRVVVKIEARLRDYVVEAATGRHLKHEGRFTETVRLREFWTLARRGDHWILASIEQGAEGKHSLDDQIVATAWGDDETLRDEATLEGAMEEAVPDTVKISELTNFEIAGDAKAAAMDLSLADGRFAPAVLEVAARRAVAAWSEAVDGSDEALREIADPATARELLHPGDPSAATRLVVRGPNVKQIRITGLDPAAEPPTLTIDVDIAGRRYIEDRDTARVLSGNPAKETSFTERWTLALTGDAQQPWRIAAVGAGTATAPTSATAVK